MVRASDRKTSNFPSSETIASTDKLTYVSSGVNYTITYGNFVTELGVTGTLTQDGNGVAVLDGSSPNYVIRNIEAGSGIQTQVGATNSVEVSHNFTQDTTGEEVLYQPTAASPTIRSLVAGNNISLTPSAGAITIASLQNNFDSLVIVTTAADLSGTLDSSKVYWIDGHVDMGTTPIEVPQGGLRIMGYDFDTSKLYSSENSYTMFTSPVTGSGNLLMRDLTVEVTGTSSKIFQLVSDTGAEAIEITRVNYNNCTSLGSFENYRQGLEEGTGRFGGTPDLEFIGTWTGGFRIATSIVRNIDNAMTAALFKAGTGLTFGSRFKTDINADLGTTAPLADFAPANFATSSLFQLDSAIITRGGVVDPTDTTILPNINGNDDESLFRNNVGVYNTYVGGLVTVTAEAVTTISVASTFYDISGTFTAADLVHFDNPANGQLRNLTTTPTEFIVFADVEVQGTATEDISLKLVKYDASATSFSDVGTQTREINNNVSANDLAFFTISFAVTLDDNDYVKLQVANETSTNNVTIKNSSYMRVSER